MMVKSENGARLKEESINKDLRADVVKAAVDAARDATLGELPPEWAALPTEVDHPYHPGEKTCFDRCMNKLWSGYEIAKDARKATEKVAKESEGMQWKWMQDLDHFYKVTPPEVPRF